MIVDLKAGKIVRLDGVEYHITDRMPAGDYYVMATRSDDSERRHGFLVEAGTEVKDLPKLAARTLYKKWEHCDTYGKPRQAKELRALYEFLGYPPRHFPAPYKGMNL